MTRHKRPIEQVLSLAKWFLTLSFNDCFILKGPGGLHQNSLEIDFLVFSDGGW